MVLERTTEWTGRKKASKLGTKYKSARNSEVTLHSPKCFSNLTSMPVHAGKDKKPSHIKHNPNPALDFLAPQHTKSLSATQKRMDQTKEAKA